MSESTLILFNLSRVVFAISNILLDEPLNTLLNRHDARVTE